MTELGSARCSSPVRPLAQHHRLRWRSEKTNGRTRRPLQAGFSRPEGLSHSRWDQAKPGGTTLFHTLYVAFLRGNTNRASGQHQAQPIMSRAVVPIMGAHSAIRLCKLQHADRCTPCRRTVKPIPPKRGSAMRGLPPARTRHDHQCAGAIQGGSSEESARRRRQKRGTQVCRARPAPYRSSGRRLSEGASRAIRQGGLGSAFTTRRKVVQVYICF